MNNATQAPNQAASGTELDQITRYGFLPGSDEAAGYVLRSELDAMLAAHAIGDEQARDAALEQAAQICVQRALHWQKEEGSYAAGKKAGAFDAAEKIRAAMAAKGATGQEGEQQ